MLIAHSRTDRRPTEGRQNRHDPALTRPGSGFCQSCVGVLSVPPTAQRAVVVLVEKPRPLGPFVGSVSAPPSREPALRSWSLLRHVTGVPSCR